MPYLPSMEDGILFDAFLQYPKFSHPLHVFLQELLRASDGPFSPGESETIAACVSGLNRCNFRYSTHTGVAEKLGAEAGLVRHLLEAESSPESQKRLQPILGYVRKLTLTPASVSQEDVDAIIASDWNEDAVVHANLICGAFNLFNRRVEGVGIDADQHYASATVKQSIKGGYTGVNQMVDRILEAKEKPVYRQ